jgi:hypothetical protein
MKEISNKIAKFEISERLCPLMEECELTEVSGVVHRPEKKVAYGFKASRSIRRIS